MIDISLNDIIHAILFVINIFLVIEVGKINDRIQELKKRTK